MAGSAEREAIKQRALLALEDSRRALTGEMSRVSVLWHPKQFLQASVQKHRIAYIIGAALAGFVALRVLLMPRTRSTGGRLTGIMGALLWPLLRGPALQFAGRYLSSYLPQFFPPSQPPEATE